MKATSKIANTIPRLEALVDVEERWGPLIDRLEEHGPIDRVNSTHPHRDDTGFGCFEFVVKSMASEVIMSRGPGNGEGAQIIATNSDLSTRVRLDAP